MGAWIVGCSLISKAHILALIKNKGVKIVGVYDVDEERVGEAANLFRIHTSLTLDDTLYAN